MLGFENRKSIHFGGHCILAIKFQCKGPMDKLSLSTNRIARIICPLNRQPRCKAPLKLLLFEPPTTMAKF
jgi:hypothetical protein